MRSYTGSRSILVTALCVTMPLVAIGDDAAWRDARGLSCADYTTLNFCALGSYGPAWRYDVDKLFKDYADEDGFDAGDKCCECVLSSSVTFIVLGCEARTETDNSIWYDSNGHTCAFYQDHELCKHGGYGKNRLITWNVFLCVLEMLINSKWYILFTPTTSTSTS